MCATDRVIEGRMIDKACTSKFIYKAVKLIRQHQPPVSSGQWLR